MPNAFSRALKTGEYVEMELCTNCAMATANGDTSGAGEDWNQAALERTGQQFHLTPGRIDGGDEYNPFSKQDCDGCGDHLHGARFDFIAVAWSYLDQAS